MLYNLYSFHSLPVQIILHSNHPSIQGLNSVFLINLIKFQITTTMVSNNLEYIQQQYYQTIFKNNHVQFSSLIINLDCAILALSIFKLSLLKYDHVISQAGHNNLLLKPRYIRIKDSRLYFIFTFFSILFYFLFYFLFLTQDQGQCDITHITVTNCHIIICPRKNNIIQHILHMLILRIIYSSLKQTDRSVVQTSSLAYIR